MTRKLLELSHEMTVRCTGVTVKAPSKKERVERVYTIGLSELDEDKQGLLGAATIKDVPHELAKQLAEGLAPNRRYLLSFTIAELEDKQTKLFDDALEQDEAAARALDDTKLTITVPSTGDSITTTGKGLRTAHERIKRSHRSRAH